MILQATDALLGMLIFHVLLEDIGKTEGIYLQVLVLAEGVAGGVVVRLLVWLKSALRRLVETLQADRGYVAEVGNADLDFLLGILKLFYATCVV